MQNKEQRENAFHAPFVLKNITNTYLRGDIVKELEEKILKEGHALSENILKVDSFINHQVDPVLMQQIGDDFARHFANRGITKVVTIESSGIAPALTTASALKVPMIILKKQPSKVLKLPLLREQATN